MPLLLLEFVNSNHIFVFFVTMEQSVLIHRNLNGSVNSQVNESYLILYLKITSFIIVYFVTGSG